MDLSELEGYLTGLKDPVVLSPADTRLPTELRDFLATAPNARITLSTHHVEPFGSTLTVRGTSPDRWPVQGLKNVEITLGDVAITVTDGASPSVTASVAGTLPLNGSARAPVTIVSGGRPGEWRIALTGGTTGVSPTDLLLLGRPGQVSPFPIPPGLEALTAGTTVPATGFGIRFYPGTTYEAFTEFTVPLPDVRWKIIPSVLEADGVEIRGTLSTRSMRMIIVGHFRIDDVAMDIGVGLQPGTHWYAFVRPTGSDDSPEGKKIAFPGIAALAAWIARGDGSQPAPVASTFSSVQFGPSAFDLAIEDVEVGFDWKAPAFDYLQITSLLTIGALALDVVLRLPEIELSGSLHGDRPVPLAEALSSFGLSIQDVPPALKITKVGFAAQPRAGNYMLELAVDDVWRAGPLEIAEVDMVVAYSAGQGYTGKVHGLIDIGTSIRLFLLAQYAGKDGGWEFAGGTVPGSALAIGDLLGRLADDFHLGEVPEAVETLTLSDLSVSYQTGTGAFLFTCQGQMTITEVAVKLGVAIAVVSPPTGNDPPQPGGQGRDPFTGWLDIGVPAGDGKVFDLRFDAHFSEVTGAKRFAATYSHPGDTPMPDVKSLVRAFSPSAAEPIPGGITIDIRDVVFALDEVTATTGVTGKGYLFAVDVDATIDFAHLPLVGDHFSGSTPVGVAPLRVVASSAPIDTAGVKALNALLPGKVTKLPERDIARGFAVDAVLRLGSVGLPLALPSAGAKQPAPPARPPAAPPAQPPATQPQTRTNDDVTWLKVQRSFGPIKIERLGLAYRNGRLAFLLDASITVAGLTLSLDGLAIELALSAKAAPTFDLSGLGLSYTSGPVQIGGAFLKGEISYKGEKHRAYSGSAQIKTAELGLAAIGSYVQLPEGPSLFVYAYLDYPIGGPPVFFVRGLAAGFGYNRRLVPPPIDGIATFPLVAQAVGGRQGDTSLAAELAQLADYLPPSIGDYFLAVGVHFTSFEMIDSFVLLVVQFGHRFEVDILGLSTLILPAPDAAAAGVTPIAEVQLALRASFVPDDGYLTIAAQLTRNSFLLSRDCHLTGGFAFSTWFGSDHHGDFVVSVGGYHPHVDVPKHYPAVPRLGFSWQVSPQLALSGGAYFALTPAALMAGGSLKATWQDDSLHAWFDASMDFLVAWQPYHYTAAMHVSVGASYVFSIAGTNPITVHASADVRLWGPDFGGTAVIDLGIVSFTVTFPEGAEEVKEPKPVEWPRFRAAMLPDPDKIVTISLQGDTRQGEAKAETSTPVASDPEKTDLGITDAAGLVLRTDSVVPSTAGTRGTAPAPLPADRMTTVFGVGPVGVPRGKVTSTQQIKITKGGRPVDDRFGYVPVGKNLPFALWGDRLTPSANGPQLIGDMLCGYTIRPLPPTAPGRQPWLSRTDLQAPSALYREAGAIRLEFPPPITVSDGDARRRQGAIAKSLADPGTAAARAAAVRAVLPGAVIDLDGLDITDFHETPQVAND